MEHDIRYNAEVDRWVDVATGEIYNKPRGAKARPYRDDEGNFHCGVWASGTADKRGYCRIKIDGHEFLVHRIVGWFLPEDPSLPEFDHINRNPSDNRLSNLVRSDRHQNLTNRTIADNCLLKYGVRASDKKEYNRAYRAYHKERLSLYNKKYREQHRDELIAYGRAWRAKQKELKNEVKDKQ